MRSLPRLANHLPCCSVERQGFFWEVPLPMHRTFVIRRRSIENTAFFPMFCFCKEHPLDQTQRPALALVNGRARVRAFLSLQLKTAGVIPSAPPAFASREAAADEPLELRVMLPSQEMRVLRFTASELVAYGTEDAAQAAEDRVEGRVNAFVHSLSAAARNAA